jgi:uncharacterized protein
MFQDGQIRTIAKLVGVAAIIALLSYTYYAFVQARQVTNFPVSISVDGSGEVFAKPDVASFTFTVQTKEADAVAAQNAATKIMDAITAYLTSKGVEERDVRTTGYSLNPRYEYPESRCIDGYCPSQGEPKLIGYGVDQSVTVKVRKTEDAGMLIAGIGEQGAMNVGGLMFVIDDEDALKAQAREKAVADAQAKAEALAEKLNVKIIRMTGYWENAGPMPYDGYAGGVAMDMAMTKEMAVPANIPMGENTITATVNISYEVR